MLQSQLIQSDTCLEWVLSYHLGWGFRWWCDVSPNKIHLQLCTLASSVVLAIYHKTPSAEEGPPQADQALVCRRGTEWSFDSPHCLLSSQPQPVTTPFGDCGKFFDGLPLGLPSDANFLQRPWSRIGNKAPVANFHWTHHHAPASFLRLSCQGGIVQLFPFLCFTDGIFPRNR